MKNSNTSRAGSRTARLMQVLAFAVLLHINPVVAEGSPDSHSLQAASELVTKQGMGRNLLPMAFSIASRTQTFVMISGKVGGPAATAALRAQLEKLQPKYEPTWNANLAAAYAENFAPEELESLAKEGRASKYFRKVTEKQGAVGVSMQAKSSKLLNDFTTEALTNTFNQAVVGK